MRIGVIGSGKIGATFTELLAAHLPEARVVKAFNTMQWKVLRDGGSPGPLEERLALFVAGDDAEAKQRVSTLIEEIGFAPIAVTAGEATKALA